MYVENEELEYINIVKNLTKDQITVFDVGCRRGDYIGDFLEVNKDKTIFVHAFEPNPYERQKLAEKYFNSINFTINSFAISNENGEQDFYRFNSDAGMGGLSSLYKRPGIFDTTVPEKVEIKKLDDYCGENEIIKVDFLKIDVEGNELKALYGAEQMLKRKRIDFIQIEYGLTWRDAGTKITDCLEYLNNLDYKVYSYKSGKIEEVTNKEDTYEVDTCINYLITYLDIL